MRPSILAPGYAVDSTGKVIRVASGKEIKQRLTYKGYYRVGLSIGGQRRNITVHRLVAHAFVPNPENKPEVNHKDGIKTNNNSANLEWCTRKENVAHAWRTGLSNSLTGGGAILGRGRRPNRGKSLEDMYIYYIGGASRSRPYRVMVRRFKKNHSFGYFETKELAIKARNKALVVLEVER